MIRSIREHQGAAAQWEFCSDHIPPARRFSLSLVGGGSLFSQVSDRAGNQVLQWPTASIDFVTAMFGESNLGCT